MGAFTSTRTRARTTLGRVAVLCVGIGVLAACEAPPPTPTEPTYVALGDSYQSGFLIAPYVAGSPEGCYRSEKSYSELLAAARPALQPMRNMTCSGATTADLTSSQLSGQPAQFDALVSATTLVTLGMGGNDIGFSSIVSGCNVAVTLGGLNPCRDKFDHGGSDDRYPLIAAMRASLTSAYQQVAQRSPNARVLAIGYPSVLPQNNSATCTLVASGDATFLRRLLSDLNAAIAGAVGDARALGVNVEYVDLQTPSVGHEICSASPWVTTISNLFHPNAAGHAGFASIIGAQIDNPPAPSTTTTSAATSASTTSASTSASTTSSTTTTTSAPAGP